MNMLKDFKKDQRDSNEEQNSIRQRKQSDINEKVFFLRYKF